jgi:hypothetical protein
MPAALRVTREGVGIELRRGTFKIIVDGADIGTVEYGKTIDLPVEPGQHTLTIRRGRYSSRTLSFDAADGQVVGFRCHGAMVWPRWLVSFAKPDLAISLTRQQQGRH